MLLLITKSLNLCQMLIEFTHLKDSKGKSALTCTSQTTALFAKGDSSWRPEQSFSCPQVALSQTHLLFTLAQSYLCSTLAPTGLWVWRLWCLVHFADIKKKQYLWMNEWLIGKIIGYSQPQWHVLFSYWYLWCFTDICRFSLLAQLCAKHKELPV